MATAGASLSSASNSRQDKAQRKSPEKPRGGNSKRTLIESACTACQKRKSRCDGQRPSCTRCEALHTECEYHAEEGESRWSALRRKIRTLERERDDARGITNAAAFAYEQQQQHYQGPDTFSQAGSKSSAAATPPQLPPLRSVVDMPPAGGGTLQQPLPQPFPPTRPAHRQGSMASAVSSASYSSMSSSDRHD